MSQGLVVGIFPGCEPEVITDALTAAQIDAAKVKVIRLAAQADVTGDSEADDGANLEFVDVVTDMDSNSLSDDMTHGMGIMGDSGGTGVPMGRSASLGSFSSRGASARTYLTGLAIPQDEVENFNDAIEAGRCVVAYPEAGEDAARIGAGFKAAGMRNVRIY